MNGQSGDGASNWQSRDEEQPAVMKKISCPDCGPVVVEVNTFASGRPIAGDCPECGERLYFE